MISSKKPRISADLRKLRSFGENKTYFFLVPLTFPRVTGSVNALQERLLFRPRLEVKGIRSQRRIDIFCPSPKIKIIGTDEISMLVAFILRYRSHRKK